MIEDIYNPSELFRTKYRKKFSEIAKETFEELVRESGIDKRENLRLVSVIESSSGYYSFLVSKVSKLSFFNFFVKLLMCVGVTCFIIALACFYADVDDKGFLIIGILLFVISFILYKWVVSPRLEQAILDRDEVERELETTKQKAYAQMKPLNRLFDWDITVRMISKTIPRIAFDPYFTSGRLRELHDNFDWDDSYNQKKSVLFAHSGEINGNPFVLGKTRYMQWGKKRYMGTRVIAYRVGRGKNSFIRRQTLKAYVEKPYPNYLTDSFLLYGNDAAPNLNFHRACSGLANAEDSFTTRFKKNWELSKLKKFSRNLNDDSQYTLLSNEEFETLFNTMNRDNEVEFRLLFTPVAQNQMIQLLKDNKDGYGDDFSFLKAKRINVIKSKHLNAMDFDNNPERYKTYSLESTRRKFIIYNEDYFRSIYFSFAPLLSIPLYQQLRTHENIYNKQENRHSCFWEHEAFANFYGDKKFAHQKCVTPTILKTEVLDRVCSKVKLKVKSYGYETESRVDYVKVLGGDGRHHVVPVPWEEYLPVKKESYFDIEEDEKGFECIEESALSRANYIQNKESSCGGGIYRRSILSKF